MTDRYQFMGALAFTPAPHERAAWREISLGEASRAVTRDDWRHVLRLAGYSKLRRIEADPAARLWRGQFRQRAAVFLESRGRVFAFAEAKL